MKAITDEQIFSKVLNDNPELRADLIKAFKTEDRSAGVMLGDYIESKEQEVKDFIETKTLSPETLKTYEKITRETEIKPLLNDYFKLQIKYIELTNRLSELPTERAVIRSNNYDPLPNSKPKATDNKIYQEPVESSADATSREEIQSFKNSLSSAIY
jgi:hypothetical protein